MPAKKILSFGILVIGIAFMASSVTCVQAQSRPPLRAPKALLDLLEKEDRDCVVQGGGLAKAVTVKSMQLANDRSQQILVKGSGSCLCGAQNCYFWIYRRRANKYELLLTGTGSTQVRAGRTSAKGYRDVISESHASAVETIIRTYRYDGSGYRPQSCVNRAYYNDDGQYTKKPIFRPCEGEKKSEPEP